jgi:hypothetical protein
VLKSKLCNSSAISSAGCHTLNPYWGLLQLQNPERSLLRAASRHNAEAHCDITILPNRCRYRAHHLRHMKYLYFSTGQRRVQSLAYLWPRWLTGAHAEVCAQPGCSIAWHNWANMILQVAADVATIQHIAHARDATSIGVTPATRGRNCAGNATGHGMNSTIVVSFSRDVGVLEAMADLSDDIEKLMRCTATEHASTQELHCTATEHAVSYAPTQSQHLRVLSTPLCQPATE